MNARCLILPVLSIILAAAPALRAADACCCAAMAAGHAGSDPQAALPGTSVYQLGGTWTTDAGRPFKLEELRGRPVVIAMFYASCGYACPRLVDAMKRIERSLPPAVHARFVLVSFDDAHDTAPVLHDYRKAHELAPADWVLLRGTPGDVRELSAVLGVTYEKKAGGGFNHSSVITILDSEGEIVHQRNGLEGGIAAAARSVVAAR